MQLYHNNIVNFIIKWDLPQHEIENIIKEKHTQQEEWEMKDEMVWARGSLGWHHIMTSILKTDPTGLDDFWS